MLLTHATLATLVSDQDYGFIRDGAVALKGDKIAWVGPMSEIPKTFRGTEPFDVQGRLVTPGFIDCHSHIVYGGNRAAEFEQRLNGASYQEIAQAGGGIISTVKATRAASEEDLLSTAISRVEAMLAQGVTTLEIKSGYGLDRETELKMLRVARAIGSKCRVSVYTSFLGAHAIPPEYEGQPDTYIDDVCIPTLRAAHDEGLVDAVDGFCEGIAFDAEQIARVFDVARQLNLPIKLHAEQLSNIGGTQLAARYKALSADHLEYATSDDAAALARSGSVAVILPGAFYTLREERPPPIDAFRTHGVPMALATDSNPGSSPMTSLLLAMNMGCTLFRMTPMEALMGVTRNATRALGLSDRGTIQPGARADLAVWQADHPAELSYRIGDTALHCRIFEGAL
ncbi:imidazolonepropionase [Pseudaestuariivita rosea]|uniref:imidazolonepropionase n=1 Tax=Pseudaestuariivita rosea TaxID=2763263 RepID=UPI001ABB9F91|nr:imidazolonepropionase [Pseudaestuariivita rosea]